MLVVPILANLLYVKCTFLLDEVDETNPGSYWEDLVNKVWKELKPPRSDYSTCVPGERKMKDGSKENH